MSVRTPYWAPCCLGRGKWAVQCLVGGSLGERLDTKIEIRCEGSRAKTWAVEISGLLTERERAKREGQP